MTAVAVNTFDTEPARNSWRTGLVWAVLSRMARITKLRSRRKHTVLILISLFRLSPAIMPRATDGLTVTRVVDSSGYVSFAGTNYRVGNRWRGRSAQVCIIADSVQLSCDGQIIRVHPIRHDRAKEHGAFATPNGRPRHRKDAPAGAGVKATPLRGRPAGRALTPTPHTGAVGSDAEPPDPPDNVDHVKQVPELIRQAGTGT